MKMTETCSCGAKFEVEGSNLFCVLQCASFLMTHATCKEKTSEEEEKE